jgi:hypothetical protein
MKHSYSVIVFQLHVRILVAAVPTLGWLQEGAVMQLGTTRSEFDMQNVEIAQAAVPLEIRFSGAF